MKSSLALTILILFNVSTKVFGQVCQGDFHTQTEVDNFIVENPGCTTLGFLNISYSETDPIINLDGLSNITTVLGDVDAYRSTVTDYSGLDNIREIGTLFLSSWIRNDSTYARFESLERVESLFLWGSDVKEYHGLANLQTVVFDVEVRNNDSLATLSFLRNIESVGPSLIIDNNQSLSAIVGFDSPRFVWAGGSVEVTNNPQLNDCEVWGFCQFVQDYVSRIENNGPGCNNLSIWRDGCPYGYLATEVDSNTCTNVTTINIDRLIAASIEPFVVADAFNRLHCVFHPLENVLGSTTFEVYVDTDLPSANVPYCQRRHSIISETAPIDSVYLRLYYNTQEVETLMNADVDIKGLEDLRISVAPSGCDDDPIEIVATFTPTYREVLRDSVSFVFDIIATSLGTFYLHGTKDLLLGSVDVLYEGDKVYPNPVSDVIFTAAVLGSRYQVINFSGCPIRTGIVTSQGSIDLSNLPPGAYILKLDDGQRRHRIVKL